MLDLIETLEQLKRFGSKADGGFDVIAPSLLGFGFSDRPARPIVPRKMAHVFNRLMTDVLGCDGYIAQGGD